MFKRLLITLAVVSLFLPALALADQILQVNEPGSGHTDFQIIDNSDSSESVHINADLAVSLNDLGYGALVGRTDLTAQFTMDATTSAPASVSGSVLNEYSFAFGTFSILLDGALPGHRNLLSGTFGPNAYLTGTNGGQGATFTDSWPTSASTEIVFTTDYASVLGAGLTNETLSMALSSLTTNLGIAGGGSSGFVTSTAGAVVGTFSDDYGTSTPEPASMLLSGGALLGLGALLRKRKAQAVR